MDLLSVSLIHPTYRWKIIWGKRAIYLEPSMMDFMSLFGSMQMVFQYTAFEVIKNHLCHLFLKACLDPKFLAATEEVSYVGINPVWPENARKARDEVFTSCHWKVHWSVFLIINAENYFKILRISDIKS